MGVGVNVCQGMCLVNKSCGSKYMLTSLVCIVCNIVSVIDRPKVEFAGEEPGDGKKQGHSSVGLEPKASWLSDDHRNASTTQRTRPCDCDESNKLGVVREDVCATHW